MPFREHAAFRSPANRDAVIWRYFDVPRLLNCLQHRALWFARGDQLGDAWEGSISAATLAAHGKEMPRVAKAWLLKSAVSCWHLNEHESAAMWDRYGRSAIAVAVRSTVARFIAALDSSREDVFLTPVNYIDYDRTVIPIDNALHPIVHKRLSYASEHELRGVTMLETPAAMVHDLRDNPVGVYVPVHVLTLIEAVYVAPTAPPWFAATVERAVRDTLGVEIPVRQSRLGEQPLF